MVTIEVSGGGDLVLSAVEARELTDQIQSSLDSIWGLIECAYRKRAWVALGYESWDSYCSVEFGSSRIKLPREERAEVVASLRESGLSVRAIASATGLGKSTVDRSLAPVPNGTPAPVTGIDGKTYTPKSKDDVIDAEVIETFQCWSCQEGFPVEVGTDMDEGTICNDCLDVYDNIEREAETQPTPEKPEDDESNDQAMVEANMINAINQLFRRDQIRKYSPRAKQLLITALEKAITKLKED